MFSFLKKRMQQIQLHSWATVSVSSTTQPALSHTQTHTQLRLDFSDFRKLFMRLGKNAAAAHDALRHTDSARFQLFLGRSSQTRKFLFSSVSSKQYSNGSLCVSVSVWVCVVCVYERGKTSSWVECFQRRVERAGCLAAHVNVSDRYSTWRSENRESNSGPKRARISVCRERNVSMPSKSICI